MLLGIGLHSAIGFVPFRTEDRPSGVLLDLFVLFVHGFRMPVFFLISGFFTAMLWRRRGLQALVKHRLRRILLPLAIGVFTILPAIVLGAVAGFALAGYDLDKLDARETAARYEDNINDENLADDQGLLKDNGGEEEFDLAHMWFLWFLMWMLAGFVVVVKLGHWLRQRRAGPSGGGKAVGRPSRGGAARIVMWSLPALTLLPQWAMVEGIFGPDTSGALLPPVHILAYYACFFGFGALLYDQRDQAGVPAIESLGGRWVVLLAISALTFLPGLTLLESAWAVSAVFQVVFAWMMCFGLMGLFRRFMSAERFWVRFLSDSSYWMYLAHLPLVFVAQGAVANWSMDPLIKSLIVVLSITGVLLIAYRYLVRYHFIGTLLNGRRSRADDLARRAELRAAAHLANPA